MATDPPSLRDATISGNIVFRSFAVSLAGGAAAEAPRLPEHDPSDIMRDGEPDLFSALRWDHGLAATLRGRDADLAAILDWADDGRATVAARLVSGPGGAGKTRLAVEAARALRQRGWAAGLLRVGAESGRVIDAGDRAPGAGLFLIVDYPEERLSVVEGLLRDVADATHPPIPLRFLLVSRRGFADWEAQARLLRGRFGRQEVATPGPLSPEDALGTLAETAEAFARVAGRVVPPLDAARGWLAGDPNRRLPLFAMAAGVHAVLTGRGDFALGAPELVVELAKRELDRVRPISQRAGLGERGLERLLALALLAPAGLDPPAIARLGMADAAPGLTGQGLLDVVARTPWWVDGPADRRLARLEPDRPAAAFFRLALLDDPSPALPDWLFVVSERDADDFGPRFGRPAYDLAGLSPDGGGAEPLERAARAMIEASPERARAFWRLAYDETTAFTAAVAERVLAQALAEAQGEAERAGLLHNLSNCRVNLGWHEEALAAGTEALVIRRRLAAARPDIFEPDLAASLNILSNRLANLDRPKATLAAVEEAAVIHRRLAAAQPGASEANLAMSLNNLSNCLAALDRREEALAAGEEVVAIRRRQAAARPDVFEADLAGSLNNLSNFLFDLDRHEEAVILSEEAVRLLRPHFLMRPTAFERWMRTLQANYIERCAAAGVEPDGELLGPIAAALSELGR